MTDLIVRRRAEADMAEARAWYEDRREGLGDEFLESVQETFDRIRRLPAAPRVLFRNVRRVLVKRFPYGVFYKYERGRVAVIAVYHNRRDPKS